MSVLAELWVRLTPDWVRMKTVRVVAWVGHWTGLTYKILRKAAGGVQNEQVVSTEPAGAGGADGNRRGLWDSEGVDESDSAAGSGRTYFAGAGDNRHSGGPGPVDEVPPGRSEADGSAEEDERPAEAPGPARLTRVRRWLKDHGWVVRFEWRNKGYAEEAIEDHLDELVDRRWGE